MPAHGDAPSPQLFFETANAYHRTAALKAAVELDVFSAIAEGRHTAADIAAYCQASTRGTRILCDYLTVIGFLTKAGDRYDNTLDSATFLNQKSPAYMGGTLSFLLSPLLTDGFRDLTTTVRAGTTQLQGNGTVEPDHPVWVDFARAMVPMMTMQAQMMAEILPVRPEGTCKVLDIAAGHGIFGITLARRYPNVVVTALDWANVLEVARENAEGLGDRYAALPGSAFEVDFGSGYDVVLLTNFLHHFDPATNEALLRRVRDALAPGGHAATLEFVPNPDRVSPPVAAAFSLTMLGGTGAGDAYTFAELQQMFANAGFARSAEHPLPPTPQTLIISHRD